MSFISTLKNMDNKFAWSFLGFLMAVLFGAVTLYLGFYKEVKPDLNFVITADSSVLDVKENLGNLDVIYKNKSLRERQQDLRFITFRVVNQGNAPILSNYYDKNDPVGFQVMDGELADEPTLLSASNDYLKEKLLTENMSDNMVVFSNVILEPNEYFELKVLVLHEIGKNPYIQSTGKVATVNSIDVLRDFSSVNKLSFLEITFGGGAYSNLTRLVSYGLIFLFLMIGAIVSSEKLGKIKEKRRRNRLLKTFREYDSDKVTAKDSFFFDYYLNHSAQVVMEFYSLMKSEKKLASLYNENEPGSEHSKNSIRFFLKGEREMVIALKNEGFVTLKDGVFTVDKQRLSVLSDFVNYLKRKGEFERTRYFYPMESLRITENETSDESVHVIDGNA